MFCQLSLGRFACAGLAAAVFSACRAKAIPLLSECVLDGGCSDGATPEPALSDARAACTAPSAVEGFTRASLCGPPISELVADFEDGVPAIWGPFDDESGTRSEFVAERGGPRQSTFAGHISGGGFSGLGAGVNALLVCAEDVRDYAGISFSAKAGGARRFVFQLVTLRTLEARFGGVCVAGCNDHYSSPPFALADDAWYDCGVRFDELAQVGFGVPAALDLCSVAGLQFLFRTQDMPFDFWLDDLRFAPELAATGCTRVEEL